MVKIGVQSVGIQIPELGALLQIEAVSFTLTLQMYFGQLTEV